MLQMRDCREAADAGSIPAASTLGFSKKWIANGLHLLL
jgi:hypothetical protein